MRRLGAVTAAGTGLAAYALYEPTRYRLVSREVPVAASCPALRILHISDTHMHRRSRRLAAWLRGLPDLLDGPPDLVLCTGDVIEDNGGIDLAVEALAGIKARLGRFYVLGSHDYYESQFRPLTKYFDPSSKPATTRPADTARLHDGLRVRGWVSLLNDTHVIDSEHGRLRLSGVDDPYLQRHRTEHIERAAGEVLAVGLMHSPDVVSEWFLAGFDLVVAGHTHAGQVRVPGVGALVTNCTLPVSLAGGLHRIGNGWLHVSPGLGVSKFSPIRFGCPPEATLLRLLPSGADRRSMTPPLWRSRARGPGAMHP